MFAFVDRLIIISLSVHLIVPFARRPDLVDVMIVRKHDRVFGFIYRDMRHLADSRKNGALSAFLLVHISDNREPRSPGNSIFANLRTNVSTELSLFRPECMRLATKLFRSSYRDELSSRGQDRCRHTAEGSTAGSCGIAVVRHRGP